MCVTFSNNTLITKPEELADCSIDSQAFCKEAVQPLKEKADGKGRVQLLCPPHLLSVLITASMLLEGENGRKAHPGI